MTVSAIVAMTVAAGIGATQMTADAETASSPTPPSIGQAPQSRSLGQARQVKQRPLVDAASMVRSAVDAERDAGLSSIVIEDASVAIWWKGGEAAIPAKVRGAIERARDVAPVRVNTARYDKSDLLAASAKVEAKLKNDRRFTGIAAEPDGSGLVVKFDSAAPADREQSAETLSATVLDVGVPTTIRRAPRLQPISRLDDRSPWSGGAKIVNTNLGVSCTAGYGVNTPNGPAILTAGHCGNAGNRFQDAAGEFIGNVDGVDKNFDVEVIPTNAVSNKIYVGGRDSSSQRTVTSGGAPFVGELLCQSGNTSAEQIGGPVCNMKVTQEDTDSQRLWEATQLDGQTAARPGDSGGPVYDDRGDGTVIARGTTTRVAGSNMGFGGFDKSQRDFNVSIPGGGGNQPPPTSGVSFYTDCGYGAFWKTLDVGTYVVQSADNQISSIRVPSGYRVVLFDANNHTGASLTKTADDDCLVDDGWNDRVSSLRVELA